MRKGKERKGYQGDSHGSRSELSGDLDDLLQRDVAVVLDVLLLLSVAQRLLERLDDVGRGGRDDHDGRLTVLADQLDRDVQALPGLGSLDDIIGDLLGGLGKATNKSAKRFIKKTRKKKSRGVKKVDTRPRGPVLGARTADGGASPPVTRRVTVKAGRRKGE